MRISSEQSEAITRLTAELAGDSAKVTLLGSRVDDTKRGGDLDLLIELPDAVENPAWLAAQLSAKISRLMAGRHADVVLNAPNLEALPIHEVARSAGVPL
jgi:hypothetical protein